MIFRRYHCDNCGDFDITHNCMLDEILRECPQCGAGVYQKFDSVTVRWMGNFRYMKGNPEVDMDKLEQEQKGG